eukprot:CAMPEP_0180138880 /NCGR_PEP_ID=MMETSP0986-20121125/13179_1 /TAXON_ID=697907 /ORGANISM="non described non described, Strain CCMP2293" /LENGTH=98 /DNA_ID=CAMNT_0022080833 /DNA_START=132 /DNA_END=428 /DNA_ORIENTATION=+
MAFLLTLTRPRHVLGPYSRPYAPTGRGIYGGPDLIRKEAWPFCRITSGVRLCWELEEPKGPNASAANSMLWMLMQRGRISPLQGYLAQKKRPSPLGPP